MRKILAILTIFTCVGLRAQDFFADSLDAVSTLEVVDSLEAEDLAEELGIPQEGGVDVDSLLACWFNALQGDQIQAGSDSSVASFSTNVPDSVLIERIEKINSFITVPYNQTVKNYMVLYSERSREKMGRILALSRYYMPIFEETFDRYDMPLELKYMAIIESSLNATARSRAGARGMWQFMYSTAKLYGLKITSFVDERLDPVKAVDAAARYLKDSYAAFGDWNLAISSYNCGAGNVKKAIRRAGSKDFWSIYPYLPRETRGYVPAFVGAMYAMNYASEYGLVADSLEFPPYTDTVEIHRNLHFKQISAKLGVPLETLRALNPQYIHDIIPGNDGTYILTLPFNYTTSFIDLESEIYAHKADSLLSPTVLKNIREGGDGQTIRYKVRSGDYLGRIASRYHCTVDQLKRWNGLKSNNIRVGQTLYIYTGGAAPKTSSSSVSKAAPVTTTDANGYTVYTVRSGDNLYDIAKRYPGVSANDIMKLNGISSSIKPGQKIRIPKK